MPSLKRNSKKLQKIKPELNYSHCTVNVYDNHVFHFDLTAEMTGATLLEEVCTKLGGIIEQDFFGLRFKVNDREHAWLKPDKLLMKQLKSAKSVNLTFRIKHYPSNPLVELVQNISRFLLFKQLRYDLYAQNIIVKDATLCRLVALAIEAENAEVINASSKDILELIDQLLIVPNLGENSIQGTIDAIESMSGIDSDEAEKEFVTIISQLDSYGLEPHSVLDQQGNKLFLGMNHQGICTFEGEKRSHIFYWENITKMSYISKTFMFDLNVESKKRKLGFKFGSRDDVEQFWLWATDRQIFMTLARGEEAKKVRSNSNVFRRKLKHKFRGRTQKELLSSYQTLDTIPQPPVIRTRNPVNVSRANSTKAVYTNSVNLDSSLTDGNSYHDSYDHATLPRVNRSNKLPSCVAIDFKRQSVASSEASSFVTETEGDVRSERAARPVSMVTDGDSRLDEAGLHAIEELATPLTPNPLLASTEDTCVPVEEELIVAPAPSAADGGALQSCPDNSLQMNLAMESDTESDVDVLEVRQRMSVSTSQEATQKQVHDTSLANGDVGISAPPAGVNLANGLHRRWSDNSEKSENLKMTTPIGFASFQLHREDDQDKVAELLSSSFESAGDDDEDEAEAVAGSGVHLIKFVVLTTLVLLVVMITSLVVYYHYRSASIADLRNKQRHSDDWNKNIDLESIKRFILRNDAP